MMATIINSFSLYCVCHFTHQEMESAYPGGYSLSLNTNDFIICFIVVEVALWDFQTKALRGLAESASFFLEASLYIESPTTLKSPCYEKAQGNQMERTHGRAPRHVTC